MDRMQFTFEKVSTTLVLLSFLTMAFFSFAVMTYGSDGNMKVDCPFSTMGASLCPQSALPGAVHHIGAYQSFINVPVNPITVFLILVSTAIVFLFLLLLYKPLVPLRYRSPPLTSHNRNILHWLSLFEHSPSRS